MTDRLIALAASKGDTHWTPIFRPEDIRKLGRWGDDLYPVDALVLVDSTKGEKAVLLDYLHPGRRFAVLTGIPNRLDPGRYPTLHSTHKGD